MELKNTLNLELDIESVGIDSYIEHGEDECNRLTKSYSCINLSVLRIVDCCVAAVCKTKDSYCFILPKKGMMHYNGHRLDSDSNSLKLATINPSRNSDFCIKQPQTSYYITIDRLTFDNRCELLIGKKYSDLEQKGFIHLKNQSSKKNLLNLLQLTIKKTKLADIDDQDVANEVLDTLIKSINVYKQDEEALKYCSFIAVKVHAYLLTKSKEPLTLDEICEATQTNRRSIQKGFKELYGMGPVEYHKLFRLHLVKKHLKKNGTVNTTLIDVIGMYGFYHSGRFSLYYKRTFGILPSRQLRDPLSSN